MVWYPWSNLLSGSIFTWKKPLLSLLLALSVFPTLFSSLIEASDSQTESKLCGSCFFDSSFRVLDGRRSINLRVGVLLHSLVSQVTVTTDNCNTGWTVTCLTSRLRGPGLHPRQVYTWIVKNWWQSTFSHILRSKVMTDNIAMRQYINKKLCTLAMKLLY